MKKSRYSYYSIIVPSFNRMDEIKELLPSIEELDFDRGHFELIVVDDGSTDGTVSYLKNYKMQANITFSYLVQENQGPGAARNNGMKNAKGDFLIIIDSDCTVPPEWLSQIDAHLHAETADAYGGPDTYRKEFPALLKAINYSMTSFITTGGLRGRRGKKLARFYPRSFNLGLSRKLFQTIGGFNEMYYGEDIEFSNRMIKSGARIIFIEQAYVYHKRRTNLRRFIRQVFTMGKARIKLYKFDPELLEPLHAIPALAFLTALLISTLAVFFEPFQYIFFTGLLVVLLLLIYSVFDAMREYRELKPSLLLPVIIPTQVIAYASGFIYAFIMVFIFNKKISEL